MTIFDVSLLLNILRYAAMETIYDQLYRDYICPDLSQTEREHKEILEGFLDALSLDHDKRRTAYDLISYMRNQWGLLTFAQGVRLGLELSFAPGRDPEDYPTLLDFLSQLHQPIT